MRPRCIGWDYSAASPDGSWGLKKITSMIKLGSEFLIDFKEDKDPQEMSFYEEKDAAAIGWCIGN